MNIVKATRQFEDWLSNHAFVVASDLDLKHHEMTSSPFVFLRATFYRWAQVWPELFPELAKAPEVLAIGDIHVESFGTWRDIVGRLVWGVNDFDDAALLPYTSDLVRLATSALLAVEEGRINAQAKDACAAILEGYAEAIITGGRPFVLAEQNAWLRQIAESEKRDPLRFWQKWTPVARRQARFQSAPPQRLSTYCLLQVLNIA